MVKKSKTDKEISNKENSSPEVNENQTAEVETQKDQNESENENDSGKKEPEDKKDNVDSKEIELKTRLQEVEEKNKELQDKYLRLSAEFDNYRKRTLREKMELTKTAGEVIMHSILPVIDDMERAINTISTAKEIDPVKEGIYLIYNKFQDFLTQNGIKEIEALNKEFNLDLHEAVTSIPAPSEELKGKVVDVITKGYILNDKVIRYSKVVVGE